MSENTSDKVSDLHIRKMIIHNFKCYKGTFIVNFKKGVNILVGDNATGKSTVLEAIHLALSGMLSGKYLKNELSSYLFNKEVEQDYLISIKTNKHKKPPEIFIELFFEGNESPELSLNLGDKNSLKENTPGLRFSVEFDEQYKGDYEQLISVGEINSIPIEYYNIRWISFAREPITARNLPIKSAYIDSSTAKFQNGSDIYISRIVKDNLNEKQRVQISQAHRKMKEAFMVEESVIAINNKINEDADFDKNSVKISVDMGTQNAWETSLLTYFDDIPFHYIGKGQQSIVKTTLALSHKKSKEANVILIEEPENHLTYAAMNDLIKKISSKNKAKQMIMSTHSSFIANKLGLDKLVFLNDRKATYFSDLSATTKNYFLKLSGYDTLRLILSKKTILVERDSDELVVQRAYKDKFQKLPIENGIDVISVGTSFLRFLEVALIVNKTVAVVTDNDGDLAALEKKYQSFDKSKNIKICYEKVVHNTGAIPNFNYNTLEPNLLRSNSLSLMNEVFQTDYQTNDELLIHMKSNKTLCALRIFEAEKSIEYPKYICDAISL